MQSPSYILQFLSLLGIAALTTNAQLFEDVESREYRGPPPCTILSASGEVTGTAMFVAFEYQQLLFSGERSALTEVVQELEQQFSYTLAKHLIPRCACGDTLTVADNLDVAGISNGPPDTAIAVACSPQLPLDEQSCFHVSVRSELYVYVENSGTGVGEAVFEVIATAMREGDFNNIISEILPLAFEAPSSAPPSAPSPSVAPSLDPSISTRSTDPSSPSSVAPSLAPTSSSSPTTSPTNQGLMEKAKDVVEKLHDELNNIREENELYYYLIVGGAIAVPILSICLCCCLACKKKNKTADGDDDDADDEELV